MERQTRQRQAIEAAIRKAGRPLLPAEIVSLAQESTPSVNIATVYRGVKALTEAGVVRAVELPGEAIRYEAADLAHHHHFRCDDCERVFDIPGCAHGLETEVPKGFEVRAHQVVLFGRCDQCGDRARHRKGPGARRSVARTRKAGK